MPAVNGVGKPCAGEPHARIDGRELETGHGSGHGGGEERPTGNRTVTAAPRLPPILVTAPAPDPPSNVFGQLLSAAGAGRGDTQAARRWGPNSGRTYRGRSGRANSGGRAGGAGGRADLPFRFLWLPAGTVGAGCGGFVPGTVLEIDWVIDLDIQKFFDTVPWDLVVKAVEAHTDQPWVLLYVNRWLRAPVQQADGTLIERDRGTPQGSAVSPVLANLFLHYAFDAWMAREFPTVPFERYVDDAVVHCVSERQAREVLAAIGARMEQVGLRLHPDKTRIVYCQDGQRRGSHEHTSFTFLGYEFRQRAARNKHGQQFSAFLPAISKQALKRIGAEVRSWRLHHRTGHTFADLARRINPIVRGWMQYYGAFYRSALYQLLSRINAYLVRWIRQKYKRLRAEKKAIQCWQGITVRYPRLFAHWVWVPSVARVW